MSARPERGGRTAPSRESTSGQAELALTALRRIVRGVRVSSRRVEEAGISAAQLFVLQHLAEGTPLSLSELGVRTMTDRTSVAHVVERLESNGLVARSRGTTDRRRTEIVLTPRGRQLLRRVPDSPTAELARAMRSLKPRELNALALSLTSLVDAMGLAEEPAPPLFGDTPEGARAPSGPIGRRRGRRR
jgi:DNA-binding MarR family transcriptional regulator